MAELVTVHTAVIATASSEHAFAPDHIKEKGEANWPEKDESKDHGNDPCRFSFFIQPSLGLMGPCGDGAHVVLRFEGYVSM